MNNSKDLFQKKLKRAFNGKDRVRLYAPQINQQSVFILRRIAWAIGKPMTISLNQIIALAISKMNIATICSSCKDNNQCSWCPFKTKLPLYSDIEQLLNK